MQRGTVRYVKPLDLRGDGDREGRQARLSEGGEEERGLLKGKGCLV